MRADGHDVRTARELGTEDADDEAHLTLAYENDWIFVTHNIKDFTLLHNAWRRWSALWGVNVMHPGIIALEPMRNAQRIVALIDERLLSGTPIVGELAVWRSRGGWR